MLLNICLFFNLEVFETPVSKTKLLNGDVIPSGGPILKRLVFTTCYNLWKMLTA